MLNQTPHPTNQELLHLVDGELPGPRASQVAAHVAECDECRTKATAIEESSTELAGAYRVGSADAHTEGARVRAALTLRMAESASRSPLDGMSRWVYACAALVALGVGLQLVSSRLQPSPHEPDVAVEAGILPRPHLTPGVVRAVTAHQLCSERPDAPRFIPASVREEVLRDYDMRHVPPHEYELDYLITPELGGADDPRNLWPERYTSGPWNAYVKDELEELLARRVCDGSLILTTAQRDMAANWIVAYKKYFNTDRPLRAYSFNASPGFRGDFPFASMRP